MAEYRVITVRLVIENRKALRGLMFAAEVLDDAAESQPWNTDLKKAAKALRRACRSMKPKMR